MNKRQLLSLVFIAIAVVALLLFPEKKSYIKIGGLIFGTTYHIIYEAETDVDLQVELENYLNTTVGNSLSTYNPNSIISRINQNDNSVVTDDDFENVFRCAYEVSKNTDGAFDMTVAPLVNLWGFGFSKKDSISPEVIDSLLGITGYEFVELKTHRILKRFPQTMLDASAIAKGYAVDKAAQFLKSNGIVNYMVEIGGEIYCSGINSAGKKWQLGIEKPIDDVTARTQEVKSILAITDKAVATSGNYRQFYEKNGKKYSHTINPKTGYPVDHNLLSATIIADNCMKADAYATACMVLGLEKSIELSKKITEIEMYLIYADSLGNYKDYQTAGMEGWLK